MPPGSIVSVQVVHPWRDRPGLAAGFAPAGEEFRVTEIAWVWPAPRVPVSGVTVTCPRPDPSVMDHATWLPVAEAIRVNEPGSVGLTVTVVALTLSVTGGGGGVVVDGAGELGLGLVSVGLGEELWVGLAELPGELLAGDGWPPAAGVGAAEVVGWVALCFELFGLLPLDVAPMLLPGADPVWKTAAVLCFPGPPLASATPISVAATTAAAAMPAAASCPFLARHHGDFGGSSGLGKP
jgi:hypothetical protein